MTEAIPERIKRHPYGDILGAIWREVHVKNGIVTIVFCGKRGKGKSYSMMEWARILDRTADGKERFTPNDVMLDPVDFLKGLTGNYPRGKVHVLDDAGLHLYKSDALTFILKNVSKILQNIRYKHPIIMMSLPHFEQLMKDARTMTDLYIEMMGVDEKNKVAFGCLQTLKISAFSGDLYRYGLLQAIKRPIPEFNMSLKHWERVPFYFSKPPDYFVREYEALKKPLLDKINNQLVNSIGTQRDIETEVKPEKLDAPAALEYCKKKFKSYLNEKGKVDPAAIIFEIDENGKQLFGQRACTDIAKKLNWLINKGELIA